LGLGAFGQIWVNIGGLFWFFRLWVSCGYGCCGCYMQVLELVLMSLFGFSFYGLALVVLVYTSGVLRSALCLYIKFSYKKIKINSLCSTLYYI
jgi:hypothetical protein